MKFNEKIESKKTNKFETWGEMVKGIEHAHENLENFFLNEKVELKKKKNN